MRLFIICCYFSWRNQLDKFFLISSLFSILKLKLVCWLLRHVDYRFLLRCSALYSAIGGGSRQQKNLARVAAANSQCLLSGKKTPSVQDFIHLSQRRRILELAATYAQNRQVLAQLAACSQRLDNQVSALHQAGSPVILAPLHMVSDILSGIVGAAAYPGQATVVVSASAEVYEETTRQMAGVNLSYCSIHAGSHTIAGNLTESIMQASENKINIIIFPDITPDYTLNNQTTETAKISCQLFNRPANLHSGVIRLARTLSAQVVFYYLYYDKEIKIHVYPAIHARHVKKKLPELLEESMTQHPQDWLLWHSHSLFFINQ